MVHFKYLDSRAFYQKLQLCKKKKSQAPKNTTKYLLSAEKKTLSEFASQQVLHLNKNETADLAVNCSAVLSCWLNV